MRHIIKTDTMSMYYVDTCLSCYVLDHCNGEDELLLGVSVKAGDTYADVKESLLAEILSDTQEKRITLARGFEDIATAATATWFANINAATMESPFAPMVQDADDDDDNGESCYAWFRFAAELIEMPDLTVTRIDQKGISTTLGDPRGPMNYQPTLELADMMLDAHYGLAVGKSAVEIVADDAAHYLDVRSWCVGVYTHNNFAWHIAGLSLAEARTIMVEVLNQELDQFGEA